MQQNTGVRDKGGTSSGVRSTLGLAIAAALGAAVGIMFAPQSGDKTRKELAKKAESLATTFQESRESIQNWLTQVFGSVSDQLEEIYLNIRGDILASIDEIEDKKHLTQKKYDAIVDSIIDEAAKNRDWAADKVEAWKDRFHAEWKDIQAKIKSTS